MINRWIPRLGEFLTLLLVGAGFVLLQISAAGTGLLGDLSSYALIAIAALIACGSARLSLKADRLCLCAAGIFCGYVVIRALTTPESYSARADLYLALAALTLYGLTVTALSHAAKRIALITALLLFAICHVLIGLVQFGLGENFMAVPFLQTLAVSQRASGLYGNPDHLAGLLEVLGVFALSIACWSRWPRWSRVVLGYLALVCYIGVALTASRGGYLSVTASLIVFGVLSLITLRAGGSSLLRKYGAVGLILLTAALLAGGFLIHQSASLSDRVTNIVALDNTRVDLWRASIQQWKLQPLIGTGSGTYRFYGRQFRAERMQADPVDVHNDYLHLLCEYGLAGLLAFLFFFAVHLGHGWRSFTYFGPGRLAAGSLALSNRLALNIGALSALGAYLVHSAVDFNLHIPANALLIAFVFGIVADPGATPGAEISRVASSRIPKLILALLGVVLLFQCARLLPGEYFAGKAGAALENEEPGVAVTLANKALVHEKQNPNIYFYLGHALIARSNQDRQGETRAAYYNEALAAFDQARLLAPLDGTYPLDMASTYDQMGRYAEAEWMYGLALARDPRSVAMAHLYQRHLETWQNDRAQKP